MSVDKGGRNMFSENLVALRKQRGYSQEELANRLGVSRQAVSKWESGQSVPDLDRVVEIADLFYVNIDTLVRGEEEDNISAGMTSVSKAEMRDMIKSANNYEYVSKIKIKNIPLVHINVGRGMQVAKGIIAIGNVAIGGFAFGGLSVGIVSLGGLSVGLLLAFAGLAIGGIAIGGFALGLLAIGGLAIGWNAIGALAIAKECAFGAVAKGNVAIGANVSGNYTLVITDATSKTEIFKFLDSVPSVSNWVRSILSFIL